MPAALEVDLKLNWARRCCLAAAPTAPGPARCSPTPSEVSVESQLGISPLTCLSERSRVLSAFAARVRSREASLSAGRSELVNFSPPANMTFAPAAGLSGEGSLRSEASSLSANEANIDSDDMEDSAIVFE